MSNSRNELKRGFIYWLSNLFILGGALLLLFVVALVGKGYYDRWQLAQQAVEWEQQKVALQGVTFASATTPTIRAETPTPVPATPTLAPTPTVEQTSSDEAIEITQTPTPDPTQTPVPTSTPIPEPFRFPLPDRMVIPRIKVDAPVVQKGLKKVIENGVEMWVPETAKDAVAHYNWTANAGEGGNAVFSGHISSPLTQEGDVFKRLDQLRPGDDIIIYAGGNALLYKVVDRIIVTPDRVEFMRQTVEPTATLISCYPDWVYTDRLIIISRLVGPAP